MIEEAEHPKSQFSNLYRDIDASIEVAFADMASLKVSSEKGKAQLDAQLQMLTQVRETFQHELKMLERHAEWDKLTVAFFGETNAGKSTIIESLRIMLDEEERQATLDAAKHDLMHFDHALAEQGARVVAAAELIAREQAEAHLRFEAVQAAAVRQIADQARSLKTIIEDDRKARFSRKLWFIGSLALVLGGMLGALVTFLVQG